MAGKKDEKKKQADQAEDIKKSGDGSADQAAEPDKDPEKASSAAPDAAATETDTPAAEAAEGDKPETGKSEENPDSSAEAEKAKAEEKPEEDGDARYMRLAADFQNFKRRTEKEKKDIYQYANEKIAVDIVEVMDNFERALAHSEESADPKLAEGVGMIYKQLKGVLDKHNIIEIDCEGADFDPNFHSAVMTEENPDYESEKVIQVFQKGYTLNGKVIRPAMVKVSQ